MERTKHIHGFRLIECGEVMLRFANDQKVRKDKRPLVCARRSVFDTIVSGNADGSVTDWSGCVVCLLIGR